MIFNIDPRLDISEGAEWYFRSATDYLYKTFIKIYDHIMIIIFMVLQQG